MQTLKTWLPAFAGMVCLGLGAGLIGIYGFFVAPLSQEFGVGAAVLNIGPVALLLVPAFVAPIVGRFADRVPIRRLMLIGVTFSVFWLLVLSEAPQLWMAGVGFVLWAVGLTMYGPVVVNGLMVKIYPGREARALAIAAMGISFASASLPPIAGLLLETMTWRMTLKVLAVSLFIILWVVIWFTVPRTGLAGGKMPARPLGKDMYRQPAFWLVGLCVALAFNAAIVLAVCYPTHFASTGFSVAQAGWFLACAGLAGLTGKSFVAWLGDAGKQYAKWLAIFLLAIQSIGLLLLVGASSQIAVIVAVMLTGFGGGAFIPMHPYLNSQYFDAAVIGQVNGAQMPLFLPFGIVGAPLAGYVFDQTGSYHSVLTAMAVVMVIAAVLALRLPASTK